MPDSRPIVLDTNIIFSALVGGRSVFADAIITSGRAFYVCESVLVELFKHKERIVKASHLSDDEVIRVLHVILRHVTVYKEDLISREHRKVAYALCRDVDETDTPHVALTLELEGLLWTGDKRLKEGLRQKGFTAFYEPEHQA